MIVANPDQVIADICAVYSIQPAELFDSRSRSGQVARARRAAIDRMHGSERMSLRSIARCLRVNPTTVYYHINTARRLKHTSGRRA